MRHWVVESGDSPGGSLIYRRTVDMQSTTETLEMPDWFQHPLNIGKPNIVDEQFANYGDCIAFERGPPFFALPVVAQFRHSTRVHVTIDGLSECQIAHLLGDQCRSGLPLFRDRVSPFSDIISYRPRFLVCLSERHGWITTQSNVSPLCSKFYPQNP